ncbi:MAG: hypothetical protein Q9M40_05685 [Sulfurimonas sp.]|nr:hypothetical protein [Sulfurimonas sp.]
MQNLSNAKLLSTITKLLILLLIAKIIGILVWWYLPSEGVELHVKKSYGHSTKELTLKICL